MPQNGNRVVLEEIDHRLVLIKEAWKKICIIRNEVVGHQTLKRTETESHEIAGMTFDDINGMIRSCQELLVFIANKFHDTHVSFNIRGAESFENLISDLQSSSSFAEVSKKLRNPS